jgi:hypothetical protein
MSVNAAAYRSIFVTNEAEKIDSRVDIHYAAPDMRKHFGDAAQGKDVVTQNLIRELTDNPDLNVYRSYPNTPPPYTSADTSPIVSLLTQEQRGGLSAEQQNELNRNFANMAEKTGLHPDRVQYAYRNHTITSNRNFEVESYERNIDGKLWWEVQSSVNNHTDFSKFPLAQKFERGEKLTPDEIAQLEKQIDSYEREAQTDANKMSPLLQKRAEQGRLNPEETAQLNQQLSDFSKKYNIPADELSAKTDAYENNVQTQYSELNTRLSTNAGKSLEAIRTDPGINNDSSIVVADYPKDSTIYNVPILGFSPNDLPSKTPPGTPDQWEFFTALHEAEHNTQKYLNGQGQEIDADRASLKVLDDIDEPGMKEYYLQSRQISSFKYGLQDTTIAGVPFRHDSATFLRVEEATGEQIDLEAFREQKGALVSRIHSKMQEQDPAKMKYSDIMGATQDVLREDAAETDPKKKLTPVQKAEAESFLQDADAMGYNANPSYPKAAPKPEKPQAEAELQQQAAAPSYGMSMTPAA